VTPLTESQGGIQGYELLLIAFPVVLRYISYRGPHVSSRLVMCGGPGYGWCFHKGNFLNIGLGWLDKRKLSRQVGTFCDFLRERGRVRCKIPERFHGHAVRLAPGWLHALAAHLLATKWFARRVVLDRWFLHRHESPF